MEAVVSARILIDELRARVETQSDRLGSIDLGETFDAATVKLRGGIQRAFDSSSNVFTLSPWPERKHAYKHPPLIKSGRMKTAATGGAGSVTKREARALSVGVDLGSVHYAGYQQWGTARIDSRPFVGASEETLDAIGELIADACLGAFDQ
jgi:hypothetical protein